MMSPTCAEGAVPPASVAAPVPGVHCAPVCEANCPLSLSFSFLSFCAGCAPANEDCVASNNPALRNATITRSATLLTKLLRVLIAATFPLFLSFLTPLSNIELVPLEQGCLYYGPL